MTSTKHTHQLLAHETPAFDKHIDMVVKNAVVTVYKQDDSVMAKYTEGQDFVIPTTPRRVWFKSLYEDHSFRPEEWYVEKRDFDGELRDCCCRGKTIYEFELEERDGSET